MLLRGIRQILQVALEQIVLFDMAGSSLALLIELSDD